MNRKRFNLYYYKNEMPRDPFYIEDHTQKSTLFCPSILLDPMK
jgi:hypothetical protein